jgi:hypothetical protein
MGRFVGGRSQLLCIDPLERETIGRVRRRLIPLPFLCNDTACLDRADVGFGVCAYIQTSQRIGWVVLGEID